ncbi:ABC transporter ATP-binding protein [Herbiconiux solani]|uniref:ABC transporter ATP-binding protein n=1 Tax=Herbiconiux solani TaxID=661329 RepID=UPI000825939D|nr:ABC transporter ATP-binding protein [Herbiconiux solani]
MTSVTPSPTPDVLCADLVRVYQSRGVEVQALQGLNLRVDPGELVAIVGESGSGKSTLLGILSGLDTPTAGTVRVAGHDLLALTPKQRVGFRRHDVGFVWQQTGRNLLPYLTVQQNIDAVTSIARTGSPAERAARSDELIALLGLEALRDRRPELLSGGQQQRAAIAVALANRPRVLFADEPTGELDDAASIDVLEALRSVNEQNGVTTVIVTHDPSVSEHVRRTVQIRDGRTSTETVRSTRTDEHGAEQVHAEEFAVLDRVGRLQLPAEFTAALGLHDRVRLALEPDQIAVRPDETQEPRP